MERQTVYTSAAQLGPFSTLVLQIASGKTSQTATALPCETIRETGASTASSPLDDTREFGAVSGPVNQSRGTSEAHGLPGLQTNLGPFMILLLSMHRHRSQCDAIGYWAVRRVGVTG